MSHQDFVFNGKNFVENYEIWAEGTAPVVTAKDITSDTAAAKNAINVATGGVDAFFQDYNKTNKPFSSWTEFLNDATSSQTKKDAILAGFVTSYRAILDMAPGGPSVPAGGDWTALQASLDALKSNNAFRRQNPRFKDDDFTIDVEQQFINSFEAFLFDYPFGSGAVANADEFFANWREYMGVTATLGSTTNDILGYRSVYDSFGFPAAEYQERLARFYLERQVVSEGGHPYFIPSHNFDEWFEELRQEFIHRNFVSSVDTETASELLVIDRILRLLISIIDLLQRVSAVQANRLGFLTDWQSAYTDHLSEVPQFAEGDDPLGGNSTKTKNFRSEANARMQAITEKVRAWRSAVQDQAKAMQSTINQSQDAANQQTQMATSIIQQLSTILSQIFR